MTEKTHFAEQNDTIESFYTVQISGLVVDFQIGIHNHEQGIRQRVRLDIAIDVSKPKGGFDDDYTRVYCYENIVNSVRALADYGHIRLVETLANRVAKICLTDVRAKRAKVTASKLDVSQDIESVGVKVVHNRHS
ncbi:dihydroneopterin aldolase [Candidatus Endolissoclinum faulkneri L2]|uniref:dihydroneopterin aldolase n=1 Tax=Candidatus Endolissoclinum faulkneri L2 TaxID=1193729 RepID=K7Z5W4_9PROT|nr:dihydroneopterin aldolase [Candidatus Endolissoclinum faulkneri]AFX99478.1 dihydroneopterin aldolase [Candidatus Endolissoclinum faulkneri L2]